MNIILLRGLVREKRHWGNFVANLKNEIPAANIMTPEIQGVGEFSHLASPSNFDEMIHFMRTNYERELSGKKNIIVAMSLGGMIAKRWCELYPTDFEKMILVNTSFKGIVSLFTRLQPLSMLNFVKIFLTPKIEDREAAIVKMTSNRKEKYDAVIKEWIEIQKTAPVSRTSFINQLKAALTFSPSLDKPKQQLMILAGQKDRLCHHRSSIKLQKIWGGNLKLHPTAGHDLTLDEPDWMIEGIKEFAI